MRAGCRQYAQMLGLTDQAAAPTPQRRCRLVAWVQPDAEPCTSGRTPEQATSAARRAGHLHPEDARDHPSPTGHAVASHFTVAALANRTYQTRGAAQNRPIFLKHTGRCLAQSQHAA